jgi:hypothetical protein
MQTMPTRLFLEVCNLLISDVQESQLQSSRGGNPKSSATSEQARRLKPSLDGETAASLLNL